jgi:hypothetical protein
MAASDVSSKLSNLNLGEDNNEMERPKHFWNRALVAMKLVISSLPGLTRHGRPNRNQISECEICTKPRLSRYCRIYTIYSTSIHCIFCIHMLYSVYTHLLYTIINIHVTNMSIVKTVYSRNLAFINLL